MSDLKSAVDYLQSLDVDRVALLPTVIGILFAAELNANEQETLGNFLIDIGDTLFTTSSLIGIQKEKEDAKSNTKTNENQSLLKDEQEKMQRQIDELQMQNQAMQKVMQELQKTLKSIHDNF